MSQQQTILRAELNGLTTTVSGTTDLQIQSIGTGTTISYSGTGTNNDHYVGTMSATTTGNSINVNFTNLGSKGTLYYDFVLPQFTGATGVGSFYISVNLFENYYFQCEYNGNTIFTEYAVSGITSQNIKINKNDNITFIINALYSLPNTTFNVYFIPDNELENQLMTYEILNLYDDIPIKINKSFAEIEDISKRNSDYSVGLKLPGSKKNNRFFENYYNVDSVTLFFDITKRVPIKVLINDESYLTGYMRLNKVNLINSKIEYDVTLFSNVADLYGKIGNNLLQDLNFNDPDYHFNHFFTLYNVMAGWQQNLLLRQDNIPLYFYPALHNGYLYTGDTVNPSGGTVASQSRFYTSTKVGTFTDYAAFVASGGTEYYINSPKQPVLDNQLKPALSVWGLIQLIFKSYGYTIKSDFFNTPWFKTLYMYGYFSSDTTKFGYQVQSIQTFPLEGVEIVFYSSGGNDYAVVCKLGTGVPSFCESNIDVVFQYDEGEPFGIVDYPLTIIAGTSGATSNYGGTFIGGYSSQVPNGTSLAYFPVPAGTFVNYVEDDSVNFNLVIDPKIKQIDFLSSIAKKFNLLFVPNPENPNEIIIEPYDFYIGTGDIHDWTDKLSFDKGFTVEPALNYIESETFLTDQEDGDDGNKQFKDQNNRIYGENHIYNETDFKSQVKKIDTIFSPQIIRKWDNNIGLPLGINYAASTDLDTTTNRVNYKYKGVKTKPKLMFNLGNFSPFLDQVGESYNIGSLSVGFRVNSQFFRLQRSDGTNPLGSEYALGNSSNPVISHTIPIGNPDTNKSGRGFKNDSLCVLFNSEQPVDTIGVNISSYNAYTENDMYNIFYSNRINNLYNKVTRFFTGNFHLTLPDIKNLKVNDLIKINDQYFTYNKIQQYNLTNQELTKVELIQYNSSHSSYPNRFFKYQYCGDAYVYKFRTYLNPSDNPEVGNDLSLYYTYYYWSVFYDYMAGSLGGNVSGFTTSFPNYSGGTIGTYRLGRFAATMTEITEDEYNSINLSFTQDQNDSIQNAMQTLSLTTDVREQNPMIWVFSNDPAEFYATKAFFNVAVDCATFTGYCNTNYVVLSNPVAPSIIPTPTPTPTPTATPIEIGMRGSLLITYNEANVGSTTPYVEAYVNSQLRNLIHTDVNTLYSTFIYSGDVINIQIHTTSNVNSINVIRRDYTTDDQGGDNGIRDTFITGTTGSSIGGIYQITFTATTTPDDYNFEYRIDTTTSFPATPTPTPTVTQTVTPTPTITQTVTPTVTQTPEPTSTVTPTVTQTVTPSITPTNTVTPTITVTPTATLNLTPTVTPTNTLTPTVTPTVTPTYTVTPTPSLSFDCFNIGDGATGGFVKVLELKAINNFVYVGGTFNFFSSVASSKMAVLNNDGTLYSGFTNLGFDDDVYSIEILSSGQMMVGGKFTQYGGVSKSRVIRLNSNGTLDNTYNSGTLDARVIDIEVTSTGKLYLAGEFNTYSGSSNGNKVVRLNSDGTMDTSWTNAGFTGGGGLVPLILDIDIQSDGKLLVGGGDMNMYGSYTTNGSYFRMNTDGSPDTTFTTPAITGGVKRIVQDVSGKIYIGGEITSFDGVSNIGLFRLNSDGTRDTSFNFAISNSRVTDFSILSSGQLIVSVSSGGLGYVYRINSDGSTDNTFTYNVISDQSGTVTAESIAIKSNGKIIIGGQFTNISGYVVNNVAQLTSDGTFNNCYINYIPTPTPTPTRSA